MKFLSICSARWLLLTSAAAVLFAAGAQAQTKVLAPSTLSCTRTSLALGFAPLPACYESKSETADQITYNVSAYCADCSSQTLISIAPITLNIGQQNGPCPNIVNWQFSGGVAGTGASAYIYGTLSAQSTKAFVRIASAKDCTGAPPTVTGANGSRLDC